jgi:endonuclease/exonuclease/phosphatase family metal-dependent hydrolase
MRSNVHRRNADGNPLFSRDAIEFYIDIGEENFLALIGNHFSSKASDLQGKRRREQATGVAALVNDVVQRTPWIAVAGDLNDHPAGGSLDALLDNSELKDAMSMAVYGGRPGTYKTASATMKLDYLLLSRKLQPKVKAVDVNRRGYFSILWEPFDDIKNASADERSSLQASDHHCLWVDLEF